MCCQIEQNIVKGCEKFQLQGMSITPDNWGSITPGTGKFGFGEKIAITPGGLKVARCYSHPQAPFLAFRKGFSKITFILLKSSDSKAS